MSANSFPRGEGRGNTRGILANQLTPIDMSSPLIGHKEDKEPRTRKKTVCVYKPVLPARDYYNERRQLFIDRLDVVRLLFHRINEKKRTQSM